MREQNHLENLLHRVKIGELSPREAALVLLSEESPPNKQKFHEPTTAQATPLSRLVEQLGEPPSDIIDVWRKAHRIDSAPRNLSQNFNEWDWDNWAVTSSAELIWIGSDDDTPPDGPAEQCESLAQIELEELANKTQRLCDTAAPVRKKLSSAREVVWVLRIGAIACLLSIAVWISLPTPSPVSEREHASTTPSMAVTNPRQESPAVVEDFPTTAPFETLESLSLIEDVPNGASTTSIAPATLDTAMFALDSLIPTLESTKSSAAPFEAGTTTDSNSHSVESPNLATPQSMDTVLSDNDSSAPPETPQAVREVTTQAVLLPSIHDVESTVSLEAIRCDQAALEFTFDTGLEYITAPDSGGAWIRDNKSQTRIANFTYAESSSSFQWTSDAANTPSTVLLAHGRLVQSGVNRTVYLRPTIQTDPLALRFDSPDQQPTWDLMHAIPPRGTSLHVEFVLPDGVEEGWIEPLDESAPRRIRALAVLTPTDGESVAIGVRLDIRCGRQLSVRIRYAARLDPSLPWQAFSRDSMLKSTDYLGKQAVLASQQLTQIEALYSLADSNERRLIRDSREAAKTRSENLKRIIQRLGELEKLANAIETDGHLAMTLTSQWPNESQVLLQTVAPEKATPEKVNPETPAD